MKSNVDIELPESWCTTTLKDVYHIFGGGTPATSKLEYWGGNIPWITSADIEGVHAVNVRKYVTEKGIDNSTTTKAPKNSLLVVTRVGLGKIAIIKEETCFSQDLQALVMAEELVIPEYTLYLLSYKLQFLKYEGRGTTISGLTKKQLKDLEYQLPPLNEQHRIVAKIEELFSELDKGIESLKTAREQLKVYRQALLKHAFEGKLTEQWRKDNADKLETADQLLERIKQEREARYLQQLKAWKAAVKQWEADGKKGKRPKKPRTLKPISHNIELIDQDSELEDLPKGWLKLQVNDCLLEPPSNGRSVKDRVGGFPVLRLTALKPPKIDIAAHKNGDWEREQAKDYIIREGDFLLSRGNGSKNLVGLGKLVPPLEFEVAYPDTMVRLRVISGCLIDEYLAQVWNSRVVRRQIEKNARTTAGIYKINQKHLAEFKLPLCSIEEQKQIVDLLSENLPLLDQMEKDIGKGLDTSEALRQSILKKAFSGQLVPQDPNDEPASALLERIAKEKEAAGAKVKKTKAAKKKTKTTQSRTRETR